MCGVFGIRAPERDVARVTYFGLFAQVFSEQTLHGLQGDIAIGHTRYSTTGSTHWANAQPLVHHGRARTVALGHNGNLTNAEELREELAENGATIRSTSDTEVIAALIGNDDAPLAEAVTTAIEKLRGAFTVTAISEGKLVAFRDPHGFRPLCLGW